MSSRFQLLTFSTCFCAKDLWSLPQTICLFAIFMYCASSKIPVRNLVATASLAVSVWICVNTMVTLHFCRLICPWACWFEHFERILFVTSLDFLCPGEVHVCLFLPCKDQTGGWQRITMQIGNIFLLWFCTLFPSIQNMTRVLRVELFCGRALVINCNHLGCRLSMPRQQNLAWP